MGLRDFLKGIADAIRAKTGKNDEIPASDFASEISNVYDSGAQAEYNRFWDAYQNDPYNRVGQRYGYNYAFWSYVWNDKIYKPKYPFGLIKTVEVDGVQMQVRRCDTISQMFMQTGISDTLYPIDLTDTLYPNHSSGVFSYSTSLKTIRTITVDDRITFNNWFQNCTALENITFGGSIGQNIDFQWSTKLTKDSIMNIIEHLSTTASGKTLTLSKTAVNTAFEMTDDAPSEEWSALVATKFNWTISMV